MKFQDKNFVHVPNKHLAMYYVQLYSNFIGALSLPGQGVLPGDLLHLTDVHLTLGSFNNTDDDRFLTRQRAHYILLLFNAKVVMCANVFQPEIAPQPFQQSEMLVQQLMNKKYYICTWLTIKQTEIHQLFYMYTEEW